MVALTGQVPLSLIGKDAFQEADTIGISLPSTKQSFLVRSAAEVPGVIQKAFKAAVSGRPGPVLVDLPKSVLMENAEANYPPRCRSRRCPSGRASGRTTTWSAPPT